MVGPQTMPKPTTSAFKPTPRPRRSGGYIKRTSAMFTLIKAPPPNP